MKKRHGSDGLKTFKIGASVDNFGGDTESQLILLRFLARSTIQTKTIMTIGFVAEIMKKHLKRLLRNIKSKRTKSLLHKMKMYLTPGSPLDFSHSQQWAGPTTPKT